MKEMQPLVATEITNPLNVNVRYSWLGASGMGLDARGTMVVPFEVYTAASDGAKPDLQI